MQEQTFGMHLIVKQCVFTVPVFEERTGRLTGCHTNKPCRGQLLAETNFGFPEPA
jgi:hypothetical protein